MTYVFILLLSIMATFAADSKTPPNQAALAWWDCSALMVEDDRWPVDGPWRYGPTFADLFKKLGYKDKDKSDFFSKMIQDRKARGETVHALDLFGSGFYAQPEADTITGLRYGSMLLRNHEVVKGVQIPPQVYGDIREASTWSTLDKSMKERGIPGFDVVAMRPVAGWNRVATRPTEEKRVLKLILTNVIARLRPGGEFYFSIDSNFLGYVFENDQLQEVFQKEVWSKGFEMICVSNTVNIKCVVRKQVAI